MIANLPDVRASMTFLQAVARVWAPCPSSEVEVMRTRVPPRSKKVQLAKKKASKEALLWDKLGVSAARAETAKVIRLTEHRAKERE